MPAYSTHLLLLQLQKQTEKYLELAISEWQMIPHVQFARKPAPNSWSANECLQHLNSYGNYYLPAIEQEIVNAGKETSAASIFKTGWLGNYFTNLMRPQTAGKSFKKMRAPKDHTPTCIEESHAVIGRFIDQQEKLLQLLESAKHVHVGQVRIPISISKIIRLKLGDTFNFLVMHTCRHVLQAQRALNSNHNALSETLQLEKAIID